MNESQNLVHALARAIPAASPADARIEANRRYFKDCKSCFQADAPTMCLRAAKALWRSTLSGAATRPTPA